jgi:Holliday junction resolvase
MTFLQAFTILIGERETLYLKLKKEQVETLIQYAASFKQVIICIISLLPMVYEEL